MRIGIDGSFLDRSARYTGMGVYTRCLLQALSMLESVHEIVAFGNGARPPDLPAPVRWTTLARLPVGKAAPWVSQQIVLPWLASRERWDVIHIPGVNLRLSQPGVPLIMPCPLVVTMHDAIPWAYYGLQAPTLPWRLRLGFRLALLAVQRASVVITVSMTSHDDILRHYPLARHRIRVIPNGLEPPTRLPTESVGRVLARHGVTLPYLLYVGSFEPRKNLTGTVRGYRIAANRRPLPPLVLIVEAESGHRAAVLAEVDQLGGREGLHFLHSLPTNELTALYQGATLFLYPSHYEGFGFTPLQALAHGVPTIASCAGSLPEVLGSAARLVDASSPDSLADAIVGLMDHPRCARSLGDQGPAQAARFRWDACARETMAAYEAAALLADRSTGVEHR